MDGVASHILASHMHLAHKHTHTHTKTHTNPHTHTLNDGGGLRGWQGALVRADIEEAVAGVLGEGEEITFHS